MASKSLAGADYLLLLLYLDDRKPILGAVRLIKMMFLFSKEIAPELKKKGLDVSAPPQFIAYNFGPFSKDVYEQIELFRGIKFIEVQNIRARESMAEVDDWEEGPFVDETVSDDYVLNQDGKYLKYDISPTGACFVEERIIPSLSADQIDLLKRFKNRITTLTAQQILRYVYTTYPEFTSNSLIKHEVLGHE